MPSITITFEHPQASIPNYKFGDQVAVIDDYHPQNWLTGKVIGLMLETESYSPRWWCSIKLDAPHGLTEEYLEDDLIPVTEIAFFQVEWEQLEASPTVQDWMMDCGYNRLEKGIGYIATRKYAKIINFFKDCGNLQAAISQDYVCSPRALKATGLDVPTSQKLSILRYDNIGKLLIKLQCSVYLMPVLQGQTPNDYLQHIQMYGDRLSKEMWVGVGALKAKTKSEVIAILIAIKSCRPDLKLHGLGITRKLLQRSLIWNLLYSSDTQAHSLTRGKAERKYANANNPLVALEYTRLIEKEAPSQLTIFN